MRSTRNRWGAGYVWALAGTLLLTSCSDSTDQGTASNEAEELADVETTPLQKSLNDAKPGEVVVASENSYEGTLYIPDGVHFKGDGDDKFVIKPEDGLPGLILEGPGNSQITNVLVENAGGAGILITERSVKLQDVEVTGTKINSTDEGHGILVKNAPSFEAIAVSSTGNSGSGLRIEDSDNISIVHPTFLPLDEEVIGNADIIIVHPTFLVGSESEAIVHPTFEPSDNDGLSIVHPTFLGEDDYAIIVHPTFLEGSDFSENTGDGISIVHPTFTTKKETSDVVSIQGVSVENNQGNGIHIQSTSQVTLKGAVLSQNGSQAGLSGLFAENTAVSLEGVYISENEGNGMTLANAQVSTAGNTLSEPLSLNSDDGLSIVHPTFLPTLTVHDNRAGGIWIADSALERGGKSDNPFGSGLNLNGALIEKNHGYGIRASCSSLVLNHSIVENTTPRVGNAIGHGIILDKNEQCETQSSQLLVNSNTAIHNNAGLGLMLKNGAQADIRGVIHENERGGIFAKGTNTRLQIQNPTACSEGLEQEGCRPPVIANNRLVGIGLGENTHLQMDSSLVLGTKKLIDEAQGLTSLGDGILANRPATMSITRSVVSNSARAGIVIVDDTLENGLEPSIYVSLSKFDNSPYGGVWITPDEVDQNELMANGMLSTPPFWNAMMTTCTTNSTHAWVAYGCLPLLETECNSEDGECEVSLPCDACSNNCTADDSCDLMSCNCPDDAECCSAADCMFLETDPNDCKMPACSTNNTCELVDDVAPCDDESGKFLDEDGDGIADAEDNCVGLENTDQADQDEDGIGDACDNEIGDSDGIPDFLDNCPSVDNPDQQDSDQNGVGDACDNQQQEPVDCIKDEDCDDGLDCTLDACDSSGSCSNNITANYCVIPNAENTKFCVGQFEALTGQPCQQCIPDQSQIGWSFATNVPCDDGDFCTVNDTCSDAAVCIGAAKTCEDGNPCTANTCDPIDGKCLSLSQTGACDDGLNCTLDTLCIDGECTGGTLECDDENPCIEDLCTETVEGFECDYTAKADDTPCEDGNKCTSQEKCIGGNCTPHNEVQCPQPSSLCETTFCNPDTAQCETAQIPDCCINDDNCQGLEDDEYACTTHVCENNACVANEPDDDLCEEDDYACTIELCKPGKDGADLITGCKSFNVNSNCDSDGIPCTIDACLPNEPFADPVTGCFYIENHEDCDDGKPCTTDLCSSFDGCSYESNCLDGEECNAEGNCADPSACTKDLDCAAYSTSCGTSFCDNGFCIELPVQSCDDGIDCTIDSCDQDGCNFEASDEACDDGHSCTTDTCNKTKEKCTYVTNDALCEDGIDCTVDTCSKLSGCDFDPNDAACDDGVNCTVDKCKKNEGGCVSEPKDDQCNDDIACTKDECIAGIGCTSLPDDSFCQCGGGTSVGTCDDDAGVCVCTPLANCITDQDCETACGDGICDLGECNFDGVFEEGDACLPEGEVGCSYGECSAAGTCQTIASSFDFTTCNVASTQIPNVSGNSCTLETMGQAVESGIIETGDHHFDCLHSWCIWYYEKLASDFDSCGDENAPDFCDEMMAIGANNLCDDIPFFSLKVECTADGLLACDGPTGCAVNTCVTADGANEGICVYSPELSGQTCTDCNGDAVCEPSDEGLWQCQTSDDSPVCDDQIECTLDACSEDGCEHTPDDSACDGPGSFCDQFTGCVTALGGTDD